MLDIGTAVKGEEGFSLIELAVSCALMVSLTALAASQLMPIQQKLLDKADKIQWQQEATASEYDMILNG